MNATGSLPAGKVADTSVRTTFGHRPQERPPTTVIRFCGSALPCVILLPRGADTLVRGESKRPPRLLLLGEDCSEFPFKGGLDVLLAHKGLGHGGDHELHGDGSFPKWPRP